MPDEVTINVNNREQVDQLIRGLPPEWDLVNLDGTINSQVINEVQAALRTLAEPVTEPVVEPSADDGAEPEVEREVDLGNMDAGYVEIDGTGWVPTEEYEAMAEKVLEAEKRLAALEKAADFMNTEGVSFAKLSQSPERAQTRRVLDAAKWVLHG